MNAHDVCRDGKGRLLFCALTAVCLSIAMSSGAGADFIVAYDTTVETKPAIAYNQGNGESLVVYLEEAEDLSLGKHFEIRARRFKGGVQQGGVLQPLGSGSHVAV